MIDDKYTYPGSGGVLINRLGLRRQHEVDHALNRFASVAIQELWRESPVIPDFAYLRHVHQVMFGDMLAWAGQVRDVDVAAGGTGIVYARPRWLSDGIADLFTTLAAEDYLAGVGDPAEFAARLAERWGYLSQLHPFRDGNTRSQSIYVSALARRAGHPIDWNSVDVDALRSARLDAVMGQEAALGLLLASAIHGGQEATSLAESGFHGETSAFSGAALPEGTRGLTCGAWLPRARKPCGLPEGHRGHHRSPRRVA
jgi:cell filamentation protein